jgi:ectoine hydroxylase-related dioxygenase (phytanoyl-CoA dioxygenase family)
MRSLDAQVAFFEQNGYAMIEKAVSLDCLERLRAAADAAIAARPGVQTIRNLLALAPDFEPMIDSHAGFPLLERLIGDDIQLLAMDLRTCFPNAGNMAWHVDIPFFSPQVVSLNTALYLDALTPDNGALRVVPGSHKTPFSLPETEHFAQLSGEILVECPAGTMVVFSDCLWHRTGQNATDRPRRGIFTYYGHFWHKQCTFPESPTPFPQMRQYIDGKGPRRAQLMGLYRAGSEYNYLPPVSVSSQLEAESAESRRMA